MHKLVFLLLLIQLTSPGTLPRHRPYTKRGTTKKLSLQQSDFKHQVATDADLLIDLRAEDNEANLASQTAVDNDEGDEVSIVMGTKREIPPPDVEVVEEECSAEEEQQPGAEMEGCLLHLKDVSVNIGNGVFVVGSDYRGEESVHLRHYVQGVGIEPYPTKKGVVLKPNRWALLKMSIELVDKLIAQKNEETTQHLGGNVYLRVLLFNSCVRVDIRQWWKPPNSEQVVPTKRGVSLTEQQWQHLKDAIAVVDTASDTMLSAQPCMFADDHANQLGFMTCPECSPDTWKDNRVFL